MRAQLARVGGHLLLALLFFFVPLIFAFWTVWTSRVISRRRTKKLQRNQSLFRQQHANQGVRFLRNLVSSGTHSTRHIQAVSSWHECTSFFTRRFRRFANGVAWDMGAWWLLAKRHTQLYEREREAASKRGLDAAALDQLPTVLQGGQTFLDEILCASHHAEAAYGFHTPSSNSVLWQMLTWLPQVAGRSLWPSRFVGQMQSARVLNIAGLQEEDMLHVAYGNSVFQPCFYVALDRKHECVVIATRGSISVSDWWSDLAGRQLQIEAAGVDGYAHEGTLAAALYVLERVKPVLAEAADQVPGWPVLVTGHSLGGGVASLLALLLNNKENLPPGLGPVRGVAFASSAVACRTLSVAGRKYVTSFLVGADLVPRLGQFTADYMLAEAARLSALRKVGSLLGKGVQKLTTWAYRMEHNKLDHTPVQLFPAGRILWCLPPASRARGSAELPLVVEAELSSFRCLLLHLDMINHHLPAFHFGAVRALLGSRDAAGASNGLYHITESEDVEHEIDETPA